MHMPIIAATGTHGESDAPDYNALIAKPCPPPPGPPPAEVKPSPSDYKSVQILGEKGTLAAQQVHFSGC